MLRPEVRHIFRMGRPTNFRLGTQTEYEDPYRRQAPSQALLLIPKLYHIYTEREDLRTSELVRQWSMRCQLPRPAINLWSWVLACERGHTVSAASGGHITCSDCCAVCSKLNRHLTRFKHKCQRWLLIIVISYSGGQLSGSLPLYYIHLLFRLCINIWGKIKMLLACDAGTLLVLHKNRSVMSVCLCVQWNF